jgi:hypothetical protein
VSVADAATILSCCLLAAGGTMSLAAAEPEVAYAPCPRLPADVPPPEIDGQPEDAAWRHAARLELRDTESGGVPRRRTTVYTLWDDAYLYLAFVCLDGDAQPNATMTRRDANLWEEEVVEVFLSPDGNPRAYYEIEVNPLNTLFDAFILNSGRRTHVLRDWDMADVQHRVGWDKGRWTVELALPLAEFYTAPNIPPRVGDIWRVNLYRIDRSDDPRAPELTAWSPTGNRNYHTASRFGRLVFADTTAAR